MRYCPICKETCHHECAFNNRTEQCSLDVAAREISAAMKELEKRIDQQKEE